MPRVTIQTGTMDELAGVPVGSGNVWNRPEHGAGLSVRLALPGERDQVIATGDSIELGGHRCTLEQIEPLSATGSHRLHFLIEAVKPDPLTSLSADRPDRERRVVELGDAPDGPGQASRLRRLTPEILEVLGSEARPADADWERTDREEWVEIDGAQCGPNTTTSWAWSAGSNESAPFRAEVQLVVTRWNPDEVHETRSTGYWSDGATSIHVTLIGRGGDQPNEAHLSAPIAVIDTVAEQAIRAFA